MHSQPCSEASSRARPTRGLVPVGQRLRGQGDEAEKFCVRCNDWWPATPEYFFRAADGEGGLFYCCKACFADWRLTHPRKKHGATA